MVADPLLGMLEELKKIHDKIVTPEGSPTATKSGEEVAKSLSKTLSTDLGKEFKSFGNNLKQIFSQLTPHISKIFTAMDGLRKTLETVALAGVVGKGVLDRGLYQFKNLPRGFHGTHSKAWTLGHGPIIDKRFDSLYAMRGRFAIPKGSLKQRVKDLYDSGYYNNRQSSVFDTMVAGKGPIEAARIARETARKAGDFAYDNFGHKLGDPGWLSAADKFMAYGRRPDWAPRKRPQPWWKDFLKSEKPSRAVPQLAKNAFSSMSGIMGKAATGIGTDAAAAAAGAEGVVGGAAAFATGPVGITIGAVLALGVAALGAKSAVESLESSQKKLALYNGNIAAAYAQAGLRDINRNFQTANATAGSTVELVRAVEDMKDSWQPIKNVLINIENKVGKIVAKMLTFFPADKQQPTGLNEMFKHALDQNPNGQWKQAPVAQPRMPNVTTNWERFTK